MMLPIKLMVTPYAPYRDGIAAYAVQEVRSLRASGVEVEVLSPLPSAAHHHLALGGVRGMAALVKRAGRYESVVIQFSPEMIFGACRNPAQRVAVWAGLLALAGRTKLEIRLHEIEYGPLANNPAERSVALRALQATDRLTVHTAGEADQLVERIGIDRGHISMIDHGARFAMATNLDRDGARAELGLDPEKHIFLSIGFLQEHKGFDLGIEAFGRANLAGVASLHIVGSVRVDHPDLLAYARRLHSRCEATDGVTLRQRFVSDEEFDRWIVAADTVVLPYREIWSSGVMERAKLYDRVVIATNVGGMGDQAPESTIFFDDIESLVQAFKERALSTRHSTTASTAGHSASEGASRPRGGWQVDPDNPDRNEVEAQIRDRVRREHIGSPAAGLNLGGAVDPLVSLGPLHRHQPVSARPGVTFVKRIIRRVLGWELDPIVTRLDALQRATTEAVAELEAQQGRDNPASESPGDAP